mgnify:CR=1 FL=1
MADEVKPLSRSEREAIIKDKAGWVIVVFAALLAINTYMGGNTRVRVTLGSAGVTISVDDIRGFQYVWVNGVQTAVSAANPLTVFVNGGTYSYPRVDLSDMLAVLRAGEYGESLGEALHRNVLCWNKAARRAA